MKKEIYVVQEFIIGGGSTPYREWKFDYWKPAKEFLQSKRERPDRSNRRYEIDTQYVYY